MAFPKEGKTTPSPSALFGYFRPMRSLVICTGNPGKVKDFRALLNEQWELFDLDSMGIHQELPETGDTLEANALQKARYVHGSTGMPVLADDTGLLVDHLNGAPGVRSARYAGEEKDPGANMVKLLREMEGVNHRTARFITVLAYIDGSGEHIFHGEVTGSIAGAPRGNEGFGYDPIFIPAGEDRTFAEMKAEEKNAISHRARALQKFKAFVLR